MEYTGKYNIPLTLDKWTCPRCFRVYFWNEEHRCYRCGFDEKEGRVVIDFPHRQGKVRRGRSPFK